MPKIYKAVRPASISLFSNKYLKARKCACFQIIEKCNARKIEEGLRCEVLQYTKLYYCVSQFSQHKESGPAGIRGKKKDATTRMKEKVVAGVDGGPRRFEPKQAS